MEFAAWAAGALVAHFPEVVFLVSGVDVFVLDVGDCLPEVFCFVVRFQALSGVALEVGGVEAFFGYFPDIG